MAEDGSSRHDPGEGEEPSAAGSSASPSGGEGEGPEPEAPRFGESRDVPQQPSAIARLMRWAFGDEATEAPARRAGADDEWSALVEAGPRRRPRPRAPAVPKASEVAPEPSPAERALTELAAEAEALAAEAAPPAAGPAPAPIEAEAARLDTVITAEEAEAPPAPAPPEAPEPVLPFFEAEAPTAPTEPPAEAPAVVTVEPEAVVEPEVEVTAGAAPEPVPWAEALPEAEAPAEEAAEAEPWPVAEPGPPPTMPARPSSLRAFLDKLLGRPRVPAAPAEEEVPRAVEEVAAAPLAEEAPAAEEVEPPPVAVEAPAAEEAPAVEEPAPPVAEEAPPIEEPAPLLVEPLQPAEELAPTPEAARPPVGARRWLLALFGRGREPAEVEAAGEPALAEAEALAVAPDEWPQPEGGGEAGMVVEEAEDLGEAWAAALAEEEDLGAAPPVVRVPEETPPGELLGLELEEAAAAAAIEEGKAIEDEEAAETEAIAEPETFEAEVAEAEVWPPVAEEAEPEPAEAEELGLLQAEAEEAILPEEPRPSWWQRVREAFFGTPELEGEIGEVAAPSEEAAEAAEPEAPEWEAAEVEAPEAAVEEGEAIEEGEGAAEAAEVEVAETAVEQGEAIEEAEEAAEVEAEGAEVAEVEEAEEEAPAFDALAVLFDREPAPEAEVALEAAAAPSGEAEEAALAAVEEAAAEPAEVEAPSVAEGEEGAPAEAPGLSWWQRIRAALFGPAEPEVLPGEAEAPEEAPAEAAELQTPEWQIAEVEAVEAEPAAAAGEEEAIEEAEALAEAEAVEPEPLEAEVQPAAADETAVEPVAVEEAGLLAGEAKKGVPPGAYRLPLWRRVWAALIGGPELEAALRAAEAEEEEPVEAEEPQALEWEEAEAGPAAMGLADLQAPPGEVEGLEAEPVEVEAEAEAAIEEEQAAEKAEETEVLAPAEPEAELAPPAEAAEALAYEAEEPAAPAAEEFPAWLAAPLTEEHAPAAEVEEAWAAPPELQPTEVGAAGLLEAEDEEAMPAEAPRLPWWRRIWAVLIGAPEPEAALGEAEVPAEPVEAAEPQAPDWEVAEAEVVEAEEAAEVEVGAEGAAVQAEEEAPREEPRTLTDVVLAELFGRQPAPEPESALGEAEALPAAEPGAEPAPPAEEAAAELAEAGAEEVGRLEAEAEGAVPAEAPRLSWWRRIWTVFIGAPEPEAAPSAAQTWEEAIQAAEAQAREWEVEAAGLAALELVGAGAPLVEALALEAEGVEAAAAEARAIEEAEAEAEPEAGPEAPAVAEAEAERETTLPAEAVEAPGPEGEEPAVPAAEEVPAWLSAPLSEEPEPFPRAMEAEAALAGAEAVEGEEAGLLAAQAEDWQAAEEPAAEWIAPAAEPSPWWRRAWAAFLGRKAPAEAEEPEPVPAEAPGEEPEAVVAQEPLGAAEPEALPEEEPFDWEEVELAEQAPPAEPPAPAEPPVREEEAAAAEEAVPEMAEEEPEAVADRDVLRSSLLDRLAWEPSIGELEDETATAEAMALVAQAGEEGPSEEEPEAVEEEPTKPRRLSARAWAVLAAIVVVLGLAAWRVADSLALRHWLAQPLGGHAAVVLPESQAGKRAAPATMEELMTGDLPAWGVLTPLVGTVPGEGEPPAIVGAYIYAGSWTTLLTRLGAPANTLELLLIPLATSAQRDLMNQDLEVGDVAVRMKPAPKGIGVEVSRPGVWPPNQVFETFADAGGSAAEPVSDFNGRLALDTWKLLRRRGPKPVTDGDLGRLARVKDAAGHQVWPAIQGTRILPDGSERRVYHLAGATYQVRVGEFQDGSNYEEWSSDLAPGYRLLALWGADAEWAQAADRVEILLDRFWRPIVAHGRLPLYPAQGFAWCRWYPDAQKYGPGVPAPAFWRQALGTSSGIQIVVTDAGMVMGALAQRGGGPATLRDCLDPASVWRSRWHVAVVPMSARDAAYMNRLAMPGAALTR